MLWPIYRLYLPPARSEVGARRRCSVPWCQISNAVETTVAADFASASWAFNALVQECRKGDRGEDLR